MKQMSETAKARALALREAGVKQKEVATMIGVSTKTVRRLEQRAAELEPGEVPRRRLGSGRKKSYGQTEIDAIRAAWEENQKITCTQLLLQLPQTLGHLSRKTVNNILLKELNLRSSVAAKKPFLTKFQRERRLKWAGGHRFWGRTRWRSYLFGDETYFCTKSKTGGRLVRRPPGSSRFDPRYKHKHHKTISCCIPGTLGLPTPILRN